MARTLIACDFDGTVNRSDVGSGLVRALFPDEWARIDRDYHAGRLTNGDIYRNILAPVFGRNGFDPGPVIDRLLRAAPGFRDFHDFCRRRGDELVIVSDGFDLYIRRFLEQQNLSIPFYANTLRKDGDGYVMEFPNAAAGCDDCGTCKTDVLRRLKKQYTQVVYVGDGDSDICPAAEATVFFGKRRILNVLRNRGGATTVPHFYFRDFGGIGRTIERAGGYRAVVFDLDGTIVDGFDIIYESFNHALVKMGLSPVPTRRIRKVIGPALSEGFRRLVPPHLVDEGVRTYRAYYKDRYLDRNVLFDGVRELLVFLKDNGVVTGLITNKKVNFAAELLDHFRLSGYFDFIRGAEEGYLPKPEGELMDVIAAERKLDKSKILYVGDSSIDGMFSKNSGVDFIAVGMGLGTERELYRWKPLAFCDSIPALRRTIEYLV